MKRVVFKFIVIICFTVVSRSSYAQKIQIIEKNDNYIKKEKVDKFEFINKNLSLTNCEKIAVLKGYSTNTGKIILFRKFKKMSNKFGANSYFIDNVEHASDTIYVEISVYYLDNATLEDNLKMYPQNMVYVFGDFDVKKGKTMKFKINGENVELAPFEYIESQNEVGKYFIVSIGGFLGAKVDIIGREERLPEYVALGGAGVGSGNSGQSVSFHSGEIYPLKMNFGQFLIHILKKKE